jgi:hypothetical protein
MACWGQAQSDAAPHGPEPSARGHVVCRRDPGPCAFSRLVQLHPKVGQGPDGVTGVVVLLFVGDIELLGDDGGGIAVAIAARLTSLAGADEVVVSSTVKDLVVGSGIRFQDRGSRRSRVFPSSGACSRSSRHDAQLPT